MLVRRSILTGNRMQITTSEAVLVRRLSGLTSVYSRIFEDVWCGKREEEGTGCPK